MEGEVARKSDDHDKTHGLHASSVRSRQPDLLAPKVKTAKEMGGHGGMDYIMLYRLLQCVRQGMTPDMDVYGAAAWSSVAELSVKSVNQGSALMEFPDFTRGLWRSRPFTAIGTMA